MPNTQSEVKDLGKYMVLYYAPASAIEATMSMTPEQMQEGMQQWMTWAAKCGDALVDKGSTLGGGRKITGAGSSPSDKDTMGYSVLEAENIEAAQALLAGHPHLAWAEGCELEVYETMQMPM